MKALRAVVTKATMAEATLSHVGSTNIVETIPADVNAAKIMFITDSHLKRCS